MSEALPSSSSRRSLFRKAAVAGAVGTTTLIASKISADAAENSTGFPTEFVYPAVTGPSLALWGSSTFEGARANEGVPAGFDASITTLLGQYLKIPVLNFGRGGETSTTISARRGVEKYTYTPVFTNDLLPASGETTVTLDKGSIIQWDATTHVPGYIQDVPVTLTSVPGKSGSYTLKRIGTGEVRYCPAGFGANKLTSYQEVIARSSYHVLQIGRNNLEEVERLRSDTQDCFAMAPTRSLILGHFRFQADKADSSRGKATLDYNKWAAEKYGNLFIDAEYWLRETSQQSWLRYGDLANSGIWNSPEDQKDYQDGFVPRSFYASDGIHLNGWGYIVLSRAIEAKVRELGWFS